MNSGFVAIVRGYRERTRARTVVNAKITSKTMGFLIPKLIPELLREFGPHRLANIHGYPMPSDSELLLVARSVIADANVVTIRKGKDVLEGQTLQCPWFYPNAADGQCAYPYIYRPLERDFRRLQLNEIRADYSNPQETDHIT